MRGDFAEFLHVAIARARWRRHLRSFLGQVEVTEKMDQDRDYSAEILAIKPLKFEGSHLKTARHRKRTGRNTG